MKKRVELKKGQRRERMPYADERRNREERKDAIWSQLAEQLENRASNQKVAGSIPRPCKMTLCPWARHFTLLATGNVPVLTVSRSG